MEPPSGVQLEMAQHPNLKQREFRAQGADVHWKDEAGMDALMWAVTENKPILVELLIQVCTIISIYASVFVLRLTRSFLCTAEWG